MEERPLSIEEKIELARRPLPAINVIKPAKSVAGNRIGKKGSDFGLVFSKEKNSEPDFYIS